jgi:hypothetical protein
MVGGSLGQVSSGSRPSAGIGALGVAGGVGGAERSPSAAALVEAGGWAAAARSGSRWHEDLVRMPLGYRVAR